MTTLASGMDYVDVGFQGRPQIIATAVLQSAEGVALIDPGPSTTLTNLKRELAARGVQLRDVRQVLLTHIHLDHAGGTGSLVAENPHIEVYVHERGAPHMIDPEKLIASATRLYGGEMERLWGEFVPVPASRVRALVGGERIAAGGRQLEVAHTPGHAWHHVSYFDRSSRVAFVGDTAGIRRHSLDEGDDGNSGASRATGTYILPPTPPPDVDLEAWRASADRILEWDPDTLFLTHFGPYHGARSHFQELFGRLMEWSGIVRRLLADATLDDAARERRFVELAVTDLRRALGDQEADQYGRAGRLDFSWQGLSRYWKKRVTA